MKDVPIENVILETKISKMSNGLASSQSHYIKTCLGNLINMKIV